MRKASGSGNKSHLMLGSNKEMGRKRGITLSRPFSWRRSGSAYLQAVPEGAHLYPGVNTPRGLTGLSHLMGEFPRARSLPTGGNAFILTQLVKPRRLCERVR